MFPLSVLVLPSAYIFLAAAALLQFQVLYTAIYSLPTFLRRFPFAEPVIPLARGLRNVLSKSFGAPNKFAPNLTHVLLVALMVAVIIHLERARRH